MAPTLRFAWINDGEPFQLPDIPMAGDDELDRLTMKHAKAISVQKRAFILQRFLMILSVRRVLEMGNVEKALKAWQQALPLVEPAQSRSMYEWTIENFRSEFLAYYAVEIEQKYGVHSIEEADKFLTEKGNELEAESNALGPVNVNEFRKERLVTDLWWRLKRQFKSIRVDDQDVPITKENLRLAILLPGDWNAYNDALRTSAESTLTPEEEREQFLEEPSEGDVKKKSTNSAKSEPPLKTVSRSTSAPTTATTKR